MTCIPIALVSTIAFSLPAGTPFLNVFYIGHCLISNEERHSAR